MKEKMIIGEIYSVIVGENQNKSYEYEDLKLKSINFYEGKEIYIFENEFSEEYMMYNHEGSVDWNFIQKVINDLYGGYKVG
jgi:hypothetical protein